MTQISKILTGQKKTSRVFSEEETLALKKALLIFPKIKESYFLLREYGAVIGDEFTGKAVYKNYIEQVILQSEEGIPKSLANKLQIITNSVFDPVGNGIQKKLKEYQKRAKKSKGTLAPMLNSAKLWKKYQEINSSLIIYKTNLLKIESLEEAEWDPLHESLKNLLKQYDEFEKKVWEELTAHEKLKQDKWRYKVAIIGLWSLVFFKVLDYRTQIWAFIYYITSNVLAGTKFLLSFFL